MTRKRYIGFALTAIVLSVLGTITLFFLADLYVHNNMKKKGMYNVWGYRGPITKRKQPGEQRIVVLGGSAALGWGAPVGKSFPAFLERMLNAHRRESGLGPISVVNLAWNNEGAYSFTHTLQDYTYLNYDGVIIYSGYNDLSERKNTQVFRHQSPVFKLTGYLPLLPVMMIEKAKMLKFGMDIDKINLGVKTTFVPNILDRTKVAALEIGGKIALSLEKQLGRLTDPAKLVVQYANAGCGNRWAFYCDSIHAAVKLGFELNKRVVVVTQPYISDRHVDQQKVIANMLKKWFGHNPGLRYVNLGGKINLKDSTLALDGMHLTPRGNGIIAERLVSPLLEILE